MTPNLVPLTKKSHQNLKIKKLENYDFVSEQNLAPIMAHEFSRSAVTYPIVFVENKETGDYHPVVLLGLSSKENLFVKNGKWLSTYIPAVIKRHPFALVKGKDNSNLIICIDENSCVVNKQDGQPIFNENGEPAELFNQVKKYLSDFQQMEIFTDTFTKYLQDKELFSPLKMQIKAEQQIKNIGGCHVINEEKLNQLSNDSFLELKKLQYLGPIYSHLTSIAQIERLIQFKENSHLN